MSTQVQFPIATYRFQFNRNFTFRDAARLVPYLAALGISHCYASPYLRARPGSMHGYDIIDHNSLNPEIGSAEDYEHLVHELHRHGMGQILDIVPNHMGVMGADNAWWLDVLENGRASIYADFFDIDWCPIKDELQDKVLVPILGDQYGNVLERGELKLAFDVERGEFSIFYYQHRFPINPPEYPRILEFRIEDLEAQLGSTHDDVLELRSIATGFRNLPTRFDISPEKQAERMREKEVQKRRLAALCARSDVVRNFLLENVRILNGTADDPRSFDALHELIKAQVYRLAQWRVAADDINYRRFFDINDLAALRMENDQVFAVTHQLVTRLIKEGMVGGLRIDHPDGLYDPAKYFRQLQRSVNGNGSDHNGKPVYIVAEKILIGNERLRTDWPIYGTTGYEFANLVSGLFVDHKAAARMQRIYQSFTGNYEEFEEVVYTCKKLILKVALASELNVLANALSRIALSNRHTCDFTLNSLRSALAEVIACFPVYRTYVNAKHVSPEDRRYIEHAVAAGRRKSNLPDPTVFDFIRSVLLLQVNGKLPQAYRNAVVRFAMKFQQVTSATMAKGLEDTAFYRYHRLVSLNEVGGDPSKFGTSVEAFHKANSRRMRFWPHSMLSTSTHDSKRSEDVRARIDVLSEMPAQWRASLRRWREWNREKKRVVDDLPAPSKNDEYLLYQVLIGAWPPDELDDRQWNGFTERIQQYMLKAMREAKQHSSWANPNADYEAAVIGFVACILERQPANSFLLDISEFQRRVARLGAFNSLSQTLLKLTSPGVPDIYQGNELFDFSLVDPDNRRPVDYDKRQNLLRGLQELQQKPGCEPGCWLRPWLERAEDGRLKLYVTWKTLMLRQQNPDMFQTADYRPLAARGDRADHLCAFARTSQRNSAIVVVPRLCATLLGDKRDAPIGEDVWGNTSVDLPRESKHSTYLNVFTGETVAAEPNGKATCLRAASLLRNFPVALMIHSPA